ncbi:GNAT family N-acetyltransferase [Fuchsiella alkaliacetigena]|uniref:GNAT family N-acetyltransferase n=1 Tax=Fuchsiella alkaliacetigena TaxID=957042 RepID=UPI00200B85B5|nr:GNAT family N-acetyltransferase [Fuchsiella alkaliacetigena]MCK8826079.1 GNAT family N-acetyltransferase [Fuchsiella alkaliacetigena]
MEQYVYSNEGKVLLRESTAADIPKIAELYAEVAKNEYWQSEELARIHFNLIEKLNGTTYVAVLGEKVIGHAEVVVPKSKEEPPFLIKLQIGDDFRRRKFGAELVRYSMIMVKKEGYIGYAAWPDYDKSKGLFKKLGLKETKYNQEIRFEVGEVLVAPEAELIEEISTVEELKALEMVVGCNFAVEFIWERGFELAAKEVLDFKTPIIHRVEMDSGQGVVFFDNRHLFISVPAEDTDNLDLIVELLKYGSRLAKEKGAGQLLTYIDSEQWEEIEKEFTYCWEIVDNEKRLEMEMEFDN